MRLRVPPPFRVLLVSGLLATLTHCGAPKAADPGGTQVLKAEPAGAPELFPEPSSVSIPVASAAINDTARFLAGMPAIAGNDAFGSLRNSAAWKNHALRMDALWRDFEWRHGRPISQWADAEIGDLRSSPAVFYPFSGPDFLFANLFFPYSQTFLLCGLEACDPLPAWESLTEEDIAVGLDSIWSSLDTVLQFSYFITKEMRQDLQASRFRGVLPVFLVFIARTGHVVEGIDAARLDDNGNPVVLGPSQTTSQGLIFRINGPRGAKRIFYFTQNLSNDSCKPHGPFLKFSTSLGRPATMAKSASYLMHESYFSHVRDHILTQARGLVQDPSGVPYRHLVDKGWNVRLYGNYQRVQDIFKEYEQPDLVAAQQQQGPRPLSFGIGYLNLPETTSLMVARPAGLAAEAIPAPAVPDPVPSGAQ